MICIICFCDLFNVCVSEFTPGTTGLDTRLVELGCGHTFHAICIFDWFRASLPPSCPMCRQTQPYTPIQPFCVNIGYKPKDCATMSSDEIIEDIGCCLEQAAFGEWPSLHIGDGSSSNDSASEYIKKLRSMLEDLVHQTDYLKLFSSKLADNREQFNADLRECIMRMNQIHYNLYISNIDIYYYNFLMSFYKKQLIKMTTWFEKIKNQQSVYKRNLRELHGQCCYWQQAIDKFKRNLEKGKLALEASNAELLNLKTSVLSLTRVVFASLIDESESA